MAIQTITWTGDAIRLIDQRKLPGRLVYLQCRTLKSLWKAIKGLSVRGAPALGAAAGFGMLLASEQYEGKQTALYRKHMARAADYLASSRPTAVNLFYALERVKTALDRYPQASVSQLKKVVKDEAIAIYEEDRVVCRSLGHHGAKLIRTGRAVMTVCNAGALATVDYGTALGVMSAAKAKGKRFSVFACESRPLLQGARLTAWELVQQKIPVTLICDNMAATVMKEGKVDLVITGADRIAANGDTANKIGTYNLAVLAKAHKIPFYIAAPFSTFDLKTRNGAGIPIEQRDPAEVKSFAGRRIAPEKAGVYNPAFDVTPHRLIAGFITEAGIIRPPFIVNIKKALKRHARQ